MTVTDLPTLSLDSAWTRYEAIRDRLPAVTRQGAAQRARLGGDHGPL